jgi:hypothetical protein
MLPVVRRALEAAGARPVPTNMPRAHFPFPEHGRWALGVGVPLHPALASAAGEASGADTWALKVCWSLGEEVPARSGTAGASMLHVRGAWLHRRARMQHQCKMHVRGVWLHRRARLQHQCKMHAMQRQVSLPTCMHL